MPKLDKIRFGCTDPIALSRFYINNLDMSERPDGTIGYGIAEAGLTFEKAEKPYTHSEDDLYWKIALAIPNIELAHEQLTQKGVTVTDPNQFKDVGYLAHLEDPEGFKIELIEHHFRGNRPNTTFDIKRLGGGAALNLLTLRTRDIASHHETCSAAGMKALAIQPVTDFGFTLHFYAFTDDTPPNPDLTAIENREWLYQRPYTVLELKEVHDGPEMRQTPDGHSGYLEACISDMAKAHDMAMLSIRVR